MRTVKLLSYGMVLSFLSITATSCLNDDNGPMVQEGFLTTKEVYIDLDSIQPANQVTKVEVTYEMTNTCQNFLQFMSLNQDEKKRKLGVYGSQTSGNCKDSIFNKTAVYSFKPKDSGEYTLQFWAGKDEDGKDKYLEQTVVVPEK